MHQRPALLVGDFASPPRGHARQADAVLDDGVQLAIGEVLRLGQPHVGRPGVEVLADGRVPAAVVGVARCTVICPVLHGAMPRLWRQSDRVRERANPPGRGQPARRPGDQLFQGGRLLPRTEPTTVVPRRSRPGPGPYSTSSTPVTMPMPHMYFSSPASRGVSLSVTASLSG